MVSRTERVALLAEYLAAWRVAERERQRFYDNQVLLFGASAVRTVDALSDLVATGIVAFADVNPNLGKSPADPPVMESDLDILHELAQCVTQAEESAADALRCVREALDRSGYAVSDGLDFDDLMTWAGIDLAGVERVIDAYDWTSPPSRTVSPLDAHSRRR